VEFLRSTIERHVAETDSAVGSRVLAEWNTEVAKFRKVMPRDFKRVLAVMDEARAAGRSEQETLDRVMEVARG